VTKDAMHLWRKEEKNLFVFPYLYPGSHPPDLPPSIMKYVHLSIIPVFIFMLKTAATAQQSNPYADYPVYTGRDLGVRYSGQKTVFKV
jgi:hypothetical protein